jgi:chorismate synthase
VVPWLPIVASTFGQIFRIATWGESHGPGIGVVVDGCPPRLPISRDEMQAELDRRRPGQSRITSHRNEADQVEILSGVENGLSLGTPIALYVRNSDARPDDYDEMRTKFRPSHADFTYQAKYGIRSVAGGGRASARETIGRVAAGAIARRLLAEAAGVEIVAYVKQVGAIDAEVDPATVTRAEVEATIVRCPDAKVAHAMIDLVDAVRKAGDSVGGVVEVVARKVPPGLGEPVFDRLEADLGKAMLSVPACKGFEVGSGFAGTRLRGSQHNDAFYVEGSRVRTRSNRSGGIQGGISNGEDIVVRAAFKPTATILMPQETVDVNGKNTILQARGRHDPCVLPRAVPVVEAMMALVLADHFLRQRAQCGGAP